MDTKENPNLLDDSPENRLASERQTEKRSLLSTVTLTFVLLLCILGFSYGLYKVLH